MPPITVRGLNAEQVSALKQEALRRAISMNRLALQRLTDGNGMQAPELGKDSELLTLAGTWSQEDAESFVSAIAPLQQVDPELSCESLRRPCIQATHRQEFTKADRLQISSTVLAEWLADFACASQEARNREELRRFLALPSVAATPAEPPPPTPERRRGG